MALILEYAELGDLLSYLKDKSSKLENYVSISPEGDIAEQEKPNITEEKELMVFAWQIARGMTYVHQQKVGATLTSRSGHLGQGHLLIKCT